MNNKLSFIFKKGIIVLIVFFSIYSSVYSTSESSQTIIGKNYVSFYLIEPFYVKDLIKWNPTISVVSYLEGEKSVGYVNLFNGIGENFIIKNNISYEIILDKNISLVLPPGVSYVNEGD